MKRHLSAVICYLVALITSTTAFGQTFPSLDGLSDGSSNAAHAGLLGKTYVESRYVHIGTDESVVDRFDDSFQGFDVTFNAPLPWLSEVAPNFGADIYFTYQDFGLGGSVGSMSLDIDVQSYQTGVSLYAAAFGPVRPFVQLGAQIDVVEATAVNGSSTLSLDDDDTSFIANVGVEVDIAEMASIRAAIDLNEDFWDASPITADLILWPHEQFYVRAGLFATTDGNELGGLFGGGIVF